MLLKKWIQNDKPLNTIVNCDCIKGMYELQDDIINVVVTSPPYNVGIKYDKWNDNLFFHEYFDWVEEWLSEIYRILKPDGRIALNIIQEANWKDRGGRIFMPSEYWQIMKKIGFNWGGLVDLQEDRPHRSRLTAWGSWRKASAPYIYNPKECVIIAYKEEWKRKDKKSIFSFPNTDEGKKEFQNLVFAQWKYQAQTKKITEANFSLDIPLKALKILSYENDIILDPFMGSGQTAIACLQLKRNFIGFEISKKYVKIANERIKEKWMN